MTIKRTILRDYQWKATSFLTSKAQAGERSLGLVAPTGAGKTTILHAILMKSVTHGTYQGQFTGALIAAPTTATENGFYKNIHIDYQPKWIQPRTSIIRYDGAKDLFVHREDKVRGKPALATVLAPGGDVDKPFLLTTHMQLAIWGIDVLPADLSHKLLMLDEAHHAGTHQDTELNTGLGEFSRAWRERGGTVLYTTATPYRADGMSVFPAGTERATWTRSIAEHASETDEAGQSYAPGNFHARMILAPTIADTAAQFAGTNLSAEEDERGEGYQTMVDQWVADGRPKSVFIVPAGKEDRAQRWAARLLVALERAAPGVRVVDGVGIDQETKDRFLAALDSEGKVKSFAASGVDVFLSCKRFDEGTDWPLCSHVYNWGLPSSFGLILQRWGRAFRAKARFADYPEEHRDQAILTFCLNEPRDQEVITQYEALHKEHALLLACYLADYETGVAYRNSLRIRIEKSRRPAESEAEEIAQTEENQQMEVSDVVRASMILQIAKFEASMEEEGVTGGAIQDYLSTLGLTSEERFAAEMILLERRPEADREAAEEQLIQRLKADRTPEMPELVRADLRDAFLEVLEGYRGNTEPMLGAVASWYTKITGMSAQEVAERLKAKIGRTAMSLSDAEVLTAAHRHYARTGRWPMTTSGDASLDFEGTGFTSTWSAVSQRTISLSKLLIQAGLTSRLASDLSDTEVLTAAHRHYARTGKWPTGTSGDASLDFEGTGFTSTWSAVNQRTISLSKLLLQTGLITASRSANDLSDTEVLTAAHRHFARTGKWPTHASGDASLDFEGTGFTGTWSAANVRAISLSKLLLQAGLISRPAGDLSDAEVLTGARQHYARTGKWPTQTSGDASLDFEGTGFTGLWSAVDNRAITLFNLLIQAGLVSRMAKDLSDAEVLAGARRHHARTGKWPTNKSGDASLDFEGTGFTLTWNAVSQRTTRLSTLLFQAGLTSRKTTDLSDAEVLTGARQHYARTGKWPTNKSGDASPDFEGTGFMGRWSAINQRDISISNLLLQAGLVTVSRAANDLSDDEVLTAAHRYYARTGKWPTAASGDASLDFEGMGFTLTWMAVNARTMSIYQLLLHAGLASRIANDLSDAEVLTAAHRHYARTGKWPTVRSGDASLDFGGMGFTLTWMAVNARTTSLSNLLKRHGLT